MSTLIESYRLVSKRVQELYGNIREAEAEIARLSSGRAAETTVRIAKLEEQLEKIDEYLLKIRGFQELATKNLDSQNVLTIEAPPGYRVNLNRLRNWAMMIDPSSSNDPYAQRVYVVAKCDEYFLETKKKEFEVRVQELKEQLVSGNSEDVERLREAIEGWCCELQQYIASGEMSDFIQEVLRENNHHWRKTAPESFFPRTEMAAMVAPGAYAAPLPADKEQREMLKARLGEFYDQEGGRILLPVELDNTREYILTVNCAPNKRKVLDRALQNLVLASLEAAPPGARKVYLMDGVRFSAASVSGLRELEGSFALADIPRHPEQLTATLEQIVSSFADTDELLELYDSVAEYNASPENTKPLPVSTIILFGWPHAFTGRDRELLRRIMINYERYGISCVLVSYRSSEKTDGEHNAMPEYAMQNAIRISMSNVGNTITFPGGSPQAFTWYTFGDTISADYAAEMARYAPKDTSIGNEYGMRYSLTKLPPYVREYKPLELPFGIDGRDVVHSLSFENENFAAYLVGASRSGKSTLLHTLITSMIRNYHPDNLELWLADFKQLEFKKYIEHCPAHVKYILLDESPELVYDLIDKLTEKMMERQRLFAQLGRERIDQIDVSMLKEPLPVIFVILDEFSIMSQSIAESEVYRIRLQNLLAKGAALGIKFLFSSQTFTTGIAGLTPTARAQIQQRIAMKGTREEISETLELSSNIKTEQVVNWMEALPPHYALVKHRLSADMLPVVNRVLVMYIPDYSVRDEMIDQINAGLTVSEDFVPQDIRVYKDKKPVIVDGNSYEAFEGHRQQLMDWKYQAPNHAEFTGDEIFLNVGTPRRMEAMMPIVLAPESRENIMFLASGTEMPCSAAIVVSAIESFRLQGGRVHIWAYGRNRLYRLYRNIWSNYDLAVDLEAVCREICEIRHKIAAQEEGKDLIVFLGMERICSDFELVGPGRTSSMGMEHATFSLKSLVSSGALVEQADDEPDLFSFLNGLSDEEMPSEEPVAAFEEAEAPILEESVADEIGEDSGAYNAMEDFLDILSQGSRLGYHVLSVTNSFADFKQSGAKIDFFRHRLAFQLSKDDSWDVFGNSSAVGMPEHICRYSDTMDGYSFRPYLHREFEWDGWTVNDCGQAENIY